LVIELQHGEPCEYFKRMQENRSFLPAVAYSRTVSLVEAKIVTRHVVTEARSRPITLS